MKKLLVSALTISLLAMAPFQAQSATDPFDSTCDLSGDGSSASPYLVGSEADMLEMSTCVLGSGTTHYGLSQDIYFESSTGDNIRQSYIAEGTKSFVLDGKGFGIYGLNLGVGNSYGEQIGLFGRANDLTVKNLTIHSPSVTGTADVGLVAGSIKGDLIADNLVLIADFVHCQRACGLTAGFVEGSVSLKNSTLVANHFLAGDNSAIAIGVSEGDLTVENVTASGVYDYRQTTFQETSGGLVALVEKNVSIKNVFVSVFDVSNFTKTVATDFRFGGLVGKVNHENSGNLSVAIEGAFVDTQAFYNSFFGGLIGVYSLEDTVSTALDIKDIRVRAFSRSHRDQDTYFGGLIGHVDVDDGASSTLVVDEAIIQVILAELTTRADTGNSTAYALADTTEFDSATFTDGLVDTTFWDLGSTGDGEFNTSDNQTATTGISGITTANLNDPTYVFVDSFGSSMVSAPGTLGTDDWERCSSYGPFPTYTPNACDAGSLTYSASTITGELGKAINNVTDSSALGRDQVMLYRKSPSLPRGITLDDSSGVISGTPKQTAANGVYRFSKFTAFTNPLSEAIWTDFLFDSDGDYATANWRYGTAPSTKINISSSLPSAPEPETEYINNTVIREVEVPAEYKGGLITSVSETLLAKCLQQDVSLSGQDFDKLTKVSVGNKVIVPTVQTSSAMTLQLPCLEPGKYDLKFESKTGDLVYRSLFEVLGIEQTELVEIEGLGGDTVVNAGSFKGYVAIYAKGYEGQRLSAKVGADWVIVESLDSDFERITDFTGADVEISVRIFIDRVLIRTVELITK